MIKNNNKWDPKDQILYLEEFLDLYNNRPIKDNTGGMKSAHMFIELRQNVYTTK
jgi:hypothetical protein